MEPLPEGLWSQHRQPTPRARGRRGAAAHAGPCPRGTDAARPSMLRSRRGVARAVSRSRPWAPSRWRRQRSPSSSASASSAPTTGPRTCRPRRGSRRRRWRMRSTRRGASWWTWTQGRTRRLPSSSSCPTAGAISSRRHFRPSAAGDLSALGDRRQPGHLARPARIRAAPGRLHHGGDEPPLAPVHHGRAGRGRRRAHDRDRGQRDCLTAQRCC